MSEKSLVFKEDIHIAIIDGHETKFSIDDFSNYFSENKKNVLIDA